VKEPARRDALVKNVLKVHYLFLLPARSNLKNCSEKRVSLLTRAFCQRQRSLDSESHDRRNVCRHSDIAFFNSAAKSISTSPPPVTLALTQRKKRITHTHAHRDPLFIHLTYTCTSLSVISTDYFRCEQRDFSRSHNLFDLSPFRFRERKHSAKNDLN